MKINASLSIFGAILLVVALTFLPHEIQSALLNSLNGELTTSNSMFDTRMLLSNFGHLCVFFILGYVVSRFSKPLSTFYTLTFLILLAIASELSQFFVIGREPSMSDLIINISAVCTGFFVSIVQSRPRKKASRNC